MGDRCSPSQETQYGTKRPDGSRSKQVVSGADIEAPGAHTAVVPTRPAERRRPGPREEVVSIRRGKSGFGMVLQEGCYVSHVDAGGHADRSGLKVGSVIRSVDGSAVTKLADAVRLLQQYKYREVAQVGVMPPPRMRMSRRSGRGETARPSTPRGKHGESVWEPAQVHTQLSSCDHDKLDYIPGSFYGY